MVRLYGRAPRGQRLFAPVPYGHWMTTTFVAALRHEEITAPCVFDGPMNGASFLTYIKYFLAPVLRQGDIVVMDNLASHNVKGVKEAIEQAGATVRYLPAYSPDLNPIEQAFAKLKAALRKAAARTFDTLVEAIADALDTFTPEECKNYIVNSGYRRQSRKCSRLVLDVQEAPPGGERAKREFLATPSASGEYSFLCPTNRRR